MSRKGVSREGIATIASAPAGWWAVLEIEGEQCLAPIAAWALMKDYLSGDDEPYHWIAGVDPTGEGWEGMDLHELRPQGQLVEYIYDPRPETLVQYLSRWAKRAPEGNNA